MKKKLLLLLALVVVGVGVNSCSQDADYPENDPSGDSGNWRESVTRAKAYFEAVYSPDLKTRTAQHSPAVAALSSMEVNPDWEHSLYSEDDDASYWEFPLLSEKRYGTGSPDEVRTVDRRLVVREDRQTGELSLYTSLWMPADDPSENQMSGLTLVDISDFSGNVFLFYPDGQFYYGTHFVEGQRRGTVNLREVITASPGLTRSGGGCETYFEGYLEQYCWYSSNHEMIYCTPWDLVIQYEYDVCDEDIDDTGEDDGGGGSGGNGGNPGLSSAQVQQIICNTYRGAVNFADLKRSKNNFTPVQEQFIISLANIAALYELGGSFETMKQDLVNYSSANSLYTKYNKLNNHERYTDGWTTQYNSGGENALVSGQIGDSGFQLKFYPTKNGEHNALGLVKSNFFGHAIEAALELLELIDVKLLGFPDDYLYDMHLFNALNFMNYYCN